VVDPDGNPVAGASVYLASDEIPMYQHMSVITGSDGVFRTIPMQRTGRLQLRARSGDLATPKAVVVNRANPGDVTVQLEKGVLSTIAGRVTDPQGHPISAAQIDLIIRTGRYTMEQDSGLSDNGGGYKIDSLWPDGVYFVDVSRNGYGESETAELRPQPGETLNPRDLVLYKRDSTVAGVMIDGDNKPVVGGRLYVNGPRTGYNDLTTDSNGKFSCTVVSGDRITVFYNYSPSHGYSRQSARSGDQNIVLHTAPPRLALPRAVPVTVAAASGSASGSASPEPVAGVSFDPSQPTTWRAWAFSAGLVVVGGVISGIANLISALRGRAQAR
jgi:hypothetical protein